MSPHDDVDTIARRAVAALEADASSAEETEAALAALHRGVGRSVPVGAAGPAPRRPWRAVLVGGAAAAAVLGALVIVPRVGDDSTPRTPATAAATTGAPLPTEPSPTSVALPRSTAPVSQTEVPYALQPRDGVTPVTIVEQTQPQVLWSPTFGDRPGQLGSEDCQECDPLRPYSPVVTDDGVILVVDPANDQLLAVDDGVVTTTPLPDGFLAWSSALGYDGVLYVAGYVGWGQADPSPQLVAYDPATAALTSTPLDPSTRFLGSTAVQPMPDGVSIDGGHTVALPYQGSGVRAVPTATFMTEDDRTMVALAGGDSGPLVVQLPSGWRPAGFVVPLTMTGQFAAAMETPDGAFVLAVVYPDRSAAAMPLPSTASYDGRPFVDQQGIVVLEPTDTGADVVRYPLPG